MRRLIILIGATGLVVSCSHTRRVPESGSKSIKVEYPKTKKDVAVRDNYFGKEVEDPYRWLENDTSAETAAWVRAQNKVTENYLAAIPYRDKIRKRYEELFNFEKYSAPFKEGEFTYYYKNSGLQNHAVLYRQRGDDQEAEVFLDPNTFSADGTTSLSNVNFSKDGSMAAYNISEGGSDWQKLVVIKAGSKTQTGDTLNIKFGSASWKGNDGFYYSTYDRIRDGSRLSGITESHKLYYHKVGTRQLEDKLIFGSDENPSRYIWAGVSEDERWLFLFTAKETYGNTLYIQNLDQPGAAIVPVITDTRNHHEVIYNDDNFVYIQTDLDAPTSRVVAAPLSSPGIENWKTIIEAKPEVLEASAAGTYIFCSYLKDAITRVNQHDLNGRLVREINLPGVGTAAGFKAKPEEKETYFVFTSYINPPAIYKLNIPDGTTTVYKESDVKFKPGDFESRQVFYHSKDGTRVPMIITYKKGIKLDGKNPCLLYGYGGFGVSLTPFFSTSSIILLENGGVFAVANLRGGGEYGREWHMQGIKTKKQNVFDDFMAAASYLKENKYTSKEYLAIEGGSNGGLLVGACMTQDPGMCKVALPAVGVLDMLRYHKFTAGAGWSYDYGTADESKEMFEYLYGYSPLHNLKPASYPATMISTADHDDRVVPAHSFKFAATLQEMQRGENPVLIRISVKAGHGAGKSTSQIIEEQADKWSFLFYNMHVTPYYP